MAAGPNSSLDNIVQADASCLSVGSFGISERSGRLSGLKSIKKVRTQQLVCASNRGKRNEYVSHRPWSEQNNAEAVFHYTSSALVMHEIIEPFLHFILFISLVSILPHYFDLCKTAVFEYLMCRWGTQPPKLHISCIFPLVLHIRFDYWSFSIQPTPLLCMRVHFSASTQT